MNLKEAFRYQNFLDRLLTQTNAALSIQANLLKTTRVHKRSEARSEAANKTEEIDEGELIHPDMAIKMAVKIIDEREALSRAIDAAKSTLSSGSFDMDAAIEGNKCRQTVARQISIALRSKASKKVERGTDYTFNSDGNQVPYYYDIEVSTKERFDRAKFKNIMKELLAEADKVSTQIDEAVVTTQVNYTAPWDVNFSFEDVFATFVSQSQ